MSINDRIKEARKNKGITQEQLGELIGVAKTTITGYEKNREPSAAKVGEIADALDVDVNFLFQDEVKKLHENRATPVEMEHLVKKYRVLDSSGKETVDFILNKEYERCLHPVVSGQLDLLKIIQNTVDGKLKDGVKTEDLLVDAAHYIENSTTEDEKHDDGIMNGDKF